MQDAARQPYPREGLRVFANPENHGPVSLHSNFKTTRCQKDHQAPKGRRYAFPGAVNPSASKPTSAVAKTAARTPRYFSFDRSEPAAPAEGAVALRSGGNPKLFPLWIANPICSN